MMDSADAYGLFHKGQRVLTEMSANGVRVDVPYCERILAGLEEEMVEITEAVEDTKLGRKWCKKFGDVDLKNNTQIGTMLYDVLGLPPPKETATGKGAVDEDALKKVDHPVVPHILRWRKLAKAHSTYMTPFIREQVDGFLHPSFSLATVRTLRSSSQNPNFQNIPVRDPDIGPMVRKAIVPADGEEGQLAEIDFSGIEVRVAACYHKDPTMLEYIQDPTKDMHRDMAAECFCLEPEEVSKRLRYAGKNMFVFPQFYGSYWAQCAPELWQEVVVERETATGESVREPLARAGITTYEEFADHVKEVETDFWGNRFPVYAKWKDQWWAQYRETLEYHSLTGFQGRGPSRRNQIINAPIQGSAFHCLLFSLIRLHEWLAGQTLHTVPIAQVHDSVILDIRVGETRKVIERTLRIMREDIMEAWDWLIVPLDVEVELCPPGGSWNEKKEVTLEEL